MKPTARADTAVESKAATPIIENRRFFFIRLLLRLVFASTPTNKYCQANPAFARLFSKNPSAARFQNLQIHSTPR
jgi:hypothetical protein